MNRIIIFILLSAAFLNVRGYDAAAQNLTRPLATGSGNVLCGSALYYPDNFHSGNNDFSSPETIQKFTLSGDAVLFPGKVAYLQLSGSEVGVSYTLDRYVHLYSPVPGTGNPMSFEIDEIGTYQIRATKNNHVEVMDGRVNVKDYILFNPYKSTLGFPSFDRIQSPGQIGFPLYLPKEGGTIDLDFYLSATDNRTQVLMSELREIVASCNRGESKLWDRSFNMSVTSTNMYDSEGRLQISKGPNIDMDEAEAKFYFSPTKYFRIIQAPAVNRYSISGGGAIRPGQTEATITLSGRQDGLVYRLYRDGIEEYGATLNGLKFTGITKFGKYRVKVGIPNKELWLDGEVSVWPVVIRDEISGGGTLRGNEPLYVNLPRSQAELTYILRKDGVDIDYMQGTGSPISFEVSETGTYTIVAGIPDHYESMLGSVDVVAGTNDQAQLNTAYDYMSEKIYLDGAFGGSGSRITRNITYFDGFGRPLQEIAVNAHANGSDIIIPYSYGILGRTDKEYLPYVKEGNNGAYDDSAFSPSNWSMYGSQDQQYAFTSTEYDGSPMDIVVKQTAPGAAWHLSDRGVETLYELNGATEVRLLRVGDDGTLIDNGYYEPRRLGKVTSTDEDGNSAVTFTDNQEQVILTVVQNGTDRHETYRVYDDRDQLRYILSPEASSRLRGSIDQFVIDEYAYYYEYDPRGRMTIKKLPGCEPVYMVYDAEDRLVLSQNGNQRAESPGKWSYTIYDHRNRPVETGEVILDGSPAHSVLQARASATAGYTPSGVRTPLQFNLYDSYKATAEVPVLPFSAVDGYADSYNQMIGGLITSVRTRILGQDPEMWITMTNYYDKKCRLIQSVTENIHGGRSQVDMRYDFVDNLLAQRESHTVGSETDILENIYTYDDYSRILTSETILNGGEPALITYTYNHLAQLENKTLGSTIESYDYNIRGWLKSKETPYFKMQLRHNDPQAANTARWNGNISEWEWWQGPSHHYMYGFEYDGLNRLAESSGWQKGWTSWNVQTDSYLEKGITYDLNGNILSLTRTSAGATVDNLTYTYTGNRLTGLTETVRTTPAGDVYPAGVTPYGTYSYDGNGNMISDSREDLFFRYNSLDLLSEVSSGSNVKARYNWLADGTKLRVRDNSGHGYDYIGSLIYTMTNAGLQLESALFDGGLIRPGGTKHDVLYNITDHLGSVRTIIDGDGEVREKNDYYPFGTRYGRNGYEISDNRFRYNGKEEQTTGSIGFLDYGFRMYDNKLGRWFGVDPLAELATDWSPYRAFFDNPIDYTDTDGLFESRKEARQWKRENNISGRIRKGDDGAFHVFDLRNSLSYSYVGFGNGFESYIGFDNGVLGVIDVFGKNGKEKPGEILAGSWALGGTIALTDSPIPGPMDLVGLAIGLTGTAYAGSIWIKDGIEGLWNNNQTKPYFQGDTRQFTGEEWQMQYREHDSNKNKAHWNKHTKKRAGRDSTKNRQKKGWKQNPNKKKN